MSIVNTIYKLKPHFTLETVSGCICCYICTPNKQISGYGIANIHPDDGEFESDLIGKNIALSRARIDALSNIYIRIKIEYNTKKQAYDNISREYNIKTIICDPEEAFLHELEQTKRRMFSIQRAIKKEKAVLNNYITEVNKTFDKLRKLRAKEDKKAE